MNVTRDLEDMSKKIQILSSWTASLSGVIHEDVLDSIYEVINEWDSCTKPLIQELASKMPTD